MPTMQIYATLDGNQNFTWAGFPIGSTVQFNFTCLNPADQSEPLDLTDLAVIFTMKAIDTRGLPTGDAIISRQATITDAEEGLCYIPIASGDTVPVVEDEPTPIAPGYYDVDVWAEDTDGNRQDLAFGQMPLTPAVRLPEDPVTPLPEQEPLAQGPQGEPGTPGTTLPTNPEVDGALLVSTAAGGLAWRTGLTIPGQGGNATTDNTPIVIANFAPVLTAGTGGYLFAFVTAVKSDGSLMSSLSNTLFYRINALGNLVVVSPESAPYGFFPNFQETGTESWAAAFVPNGNTLDLQVTGQNGISINWTSILELVGG